MFPTKSIVGALILSLSAGTAWAGKDKAAKTERKEARKERRDERLENRQERQDERREERHERKDEKREDRHERQDWNKDRKDDNKDARKDADIDKTVIKGPGGKVVIKEKTWTKTNKKGQTVHITESKVRYRYKYRTVPQHHVHWFETRYGYYPMPEHVTYYRVYGYWPTNVVVFEVPAVENTTVISCSGQDADTNMQTMLRGFEQMSNDADSGLSEKARVSLRARAAFLSSLEPQTQVETMVDSYFDGNQEAMGQFFVDEDTVPLVSSRVAEDLAIDAKDAETVTRGIRLHMRGNL